MLSCGHGFLAQPVIVCVRGKKGGEGESDDGRRGMECYCDEREDVNAREYEGGENVYVRESECEWKKCVDV